MKTATACLLFCLAVATTAAASKRKIAFTRGDNIWVANIDGTAVKKLAVGSAPAISPDGKRIAFDSAPISAYEHAANGTEPETHITIIDITSGKATILTNIPSERSFGPFWSPDGKWIGFESRRGTPFRFEDLAIINADGTGFRVIKPGTNQFGLTFYSPGWSRDGQSIFCHDLALIYQLGLDGAVLAQWKIDEIIPSASLTGDSSLDVSPDGNRLLLGVEMGKEEPLEGRDGPPSALWSFDLTNHTVVRVTPKKLLADDGCWLDNDSVLFVGTPFDQDGDGIVYRLAANGKEPFLKSIIKKRVPSLSAP